MNLSGKFMHGLVCAGCVLTAMSSCGDAPEAQTQAQYATMKVAVTDKPLSEKYSASIQGFQDVEVYPQVSGSITKLCVTEGQKVVEGQVLFIIDQVPYTAALRTAEANEQAARAQLATAQLDYSSAKELYAQKVVSAHKLSVAENTLLTAKAQLAQAQAQVVNARNNLSYTMVKSPSAGVVGTLPFRVGALVSPNMPQPLTTVSDNSSVYAYFSMTENQLLALTRQHGSLDEAIKSMPEVELELNDKSVYGDKGRVETVSAVIDKSTGCVQVKALFPNAGGILHSGFSGSVIIPQTHKDCIVIPQTATVKVQDKVMVYKVVDGKAVSTFIKVADTDDGKTYVVTDGLTPGEEIVSEGAGLVRDGMPVKAGN